MLRLQQIEQIITKAVQTYAPHSTSTLPSSANKPLTHYNLLYWWVWGFIVCIE